MSEFKILKMREGFTESKDQGKSSEIASWVKDTMKTKGVKIGVYRGNFDNSTEGGGEDYVIVTEAPLSNMVYEVSAYISPKCSIEKGSIVSRCLVMDRAYERREKHNNKTGE